MRIQLDRRDFRLRDFYPVIRLPRFLVDSDIIFEIPVYKIRNIFFRERFDVSAAELLSIHQELSDVRAFMPISVVRTMPAAMDAANRRE